MEAFYFPLSCLMTTIVVIVAVCVGCLIRKQLGKEPLFCSPRLSINIREALFRFSLIVGVVLFLVASNGIWQMASSIEFHVPPAGPLSWGKGAFLRWLIWAMFSFSIAMIIWKLLSLIRKSK